MYAIGDKYDLPRLCRFAKFKYQETLPHITDKDFLSLIPLVYESTPDSNRGIRDIVIWNARKNYSMYNSRSEWKDPLHEVIRTTWQFTSDLLSEFAAHPLMGDCDKCGPDQILEIKRTYCTKCQGSCSVKKGGFCFIDHSL